MFSVWLLLAGNVSAATTAVIGRVEGYIPYSTGSTEVFFVSVSNAPAVGCNVTARFTIMSNNPKYKTTVAGLIAAYHAKTPVLIYAQDTCSNFSNAADISHVCFGNIAC